MLLEKERGDRFLCSFWVFLFRLWGKTRDKNEHGQKPVRSYVSFHHMAILFLFPDGHMSRWKEELAGVSNRPSIRKQRWPMTPDVQRNRESLRSCIASLAVDYIPAQLIFLKRAGSQPSQHERSDERNVGSYRPSVKEINGRYERPSVKPCFKEAGDR